DLSAPGRDHPRARARSCECARLGGVRPRGEFEGLRFAGVDRAAGEAAGVSRGWGFTTGGHGEQPRRTTNALLFFPVSRRAFRASVVSTKFKPDDRAGPKQGGIPGSMPPSRSLPWAKP